MTSLAPCFMQTLHAWMHQSGHTVAGHSLNFLAAPEKEGRLSTICIVERPDRSGHLDPLLAPIQGSGRERRLQAISNLKILESKTYE